MSLRPERRHRRAEISIVAMVDVLMTLIFYSFLMMQFKVGQALNITLPEINTAGKNTLVTSINISIVKDGTYYYNGHVVTAAEMEAILTELGKASDKPPLVIRADESTPLKNVTFLMDTCRKTGFDDFRLQSRGSE
jgi:biopolymer transport protein ExbD